ncbi:hypothetical protein QRX42_02880 [Bifidobacterium sp. H6bp22N]|uniref:hypothetical protein n=1 Tax=Bifidobacterium polysaccharolyticum TaxID=2750967 RepID=UPI0028BD7717|nr:hypothetical protein [Bifidobacterium sp. H6bp22N]MDT7507388.1 hypothetical protein [Bifidobacterium sp. H6bp22N]
MTRELELSPRHGSELISVEYSLELANDKGIEAGISVAKATEDFGDGIYVESIEEDVASDHVQDDAQLDYKIAAACGVVAGLCDSIFVGKFSLDSANEWGSEKVNEFVVWVAKQHSGFRGESLRDAIQFLEDQYPFVGDKYTAEFGGGLQHHLRDFSHHFSLEGLVFSILTQFTGKVYGTNQYGDFIAIPVEEQWFKQGLIGDNFCEKLFLGAVRWFFHMASDMAGSSSNPGKGTGIPGPFLSIIKELSALPVLKNAMDPGMGARNFISKMFNGTLFAQVDDEGRKVPRRFNLRTEIGVVHELGRQALPVLLNECLTRGCYFLHHLYLEMKDNEVRSLSDLKQLDMDRILPFNNSRVVRMVSIASATFTAVDLADAAIRAALVGFTEGRVLAGKEFLLRVNYVGVTRLVFAIGVDVKTVWERRTSHRQRQQNDNSADRATMETLSLKPEHLSVLFSIERLALYEDIDRSKAVDRGEKEEWFGKWSENLPADCVLLNQGQVKERIEELDARDGTTWKALVLIELARFVPYDSYRSEMESENPDGSSDSSIKKTKCPKFDSKILEKLWRDVSGVLDKSPVQQTAKALNKNVGVLGGSRTRKIVGAAGTAAVAVATGGAAFTLAPVIAPVIAPLIAGSAVAGLSGAALTSASLAAVGGGALAAGGLGMAGGTAIIAGGGAVLGLVGGSGVTAVTSLLTDSKGAFALDECSKLLTFCQSDFAQADMKPETIERMRQGLLDQIERMEIQQEVLSRRSGDKGLDKAEKKETKKELSGLKKSLGYMRNCEKELVKLINQKSHS